MSESPRDRIVPVVWSLLFHGGLAALLIFGWWHWRTNRPQPAQQPLAIEATVVTEMPVAAQPTPAPETAPPEPAPAPPPEPAPAPAIDAERVRAKAKVEAQAKAESAAAKARAEQERAEREQAAGEAAAREKDARDKAVRDKAAREQEARAAAERQRKDAQRRQAEAEMRASLEAEARQTAARLSSAKAVYIAMIRERIQRAWLKPPGARAGLDCVVKVTQVSGGSVTGVNIGACNGDEAVKGSIEAAVYRASPLPEPADPAVFDRDLVFNFRPTNE